MPRLTKAEKVVQERMLSMLEWATRSPKSVTRWHDIGYDDESKKAAELLEARDAIEVSWIRRQYKLTPKD